MADSVVSGLVGTLMDMAKEKVDLWLGVPGEIQNLQSTLRNIQSVLRDAEKRRIEDKAVNDWLMELKDVMYDADDVLDEWRTAAEKCTPRESPPKRFKGNIFSIFAGLSDEVKFRHEVGIKIKDLNDRLEEI
uniref:Disease resistance N-terminal domain-containing protein n=1 Tax=Musa acuminata subsp. malaccensis TaxID=214687 RepID=A0A804IHI3_MUSAM